MLYRRMSDGNFVPVSSAKIPARKSVKAAETTVAQTDFASNEWDGWPDGSWEMDLTYDEFESSGNLQIHWAHVVGGGDRKGDEHASNWISGKKSSRRCLGIIECDNPICRVITRPHTSSKGIDKQLHQACSCGAVLSRVECDVTAYLWKWSRGVHYSNGGYHGHRRPTHLLHLLKGEQSKFEEIVKAYPKSGPLQLVVGVPGLDQPGVSVADISDVLLNAHRVSKERQKVKRSQGLSADGFLATFSQFSANHPGFVLHSVMTEVIVVCVQTDFMRSQLVRNMQIDGSVNGMVNDAAHGWWKERNSLLMVSSSYCPALLCWVPGVLSYTNGATENHFMHHFFAVFYSIAQEAESRSQVVADELFAGVSFSKNLGYISNYYNLGHGL